MKRWQWITVGSLVALAAAVAVGWATRQPLGSPGVYVNLTAPPWLVAGLLIAVVIRLGWELYRGQAILDDLDRTTDDADYAARGVARHDEELAEIREWIAGIAPVVDELAEGLADVLVTHRTFVGGVDTPPVVVEVIEAEETPVPTQPDIPAQPKRRPRPGPPPDTVPTNRAITPEAITGGQREPDVEYARILADLEDQMHAWRKYRESLEWAKS